MSEVRTRHGNVGNKNAYKGQNGKIHVRCKIRDKAGWVKQANRDGLNLTDWVSSVLNKSVDDDLKDVDPRSIENG